MEQIDTLSFGILFNENIHKENITQLIEQKLTIKYSKERKEYYYVGKCTKYSFYFIETYYCLIVTLQHNLIQKKTDEEIQEATTKFIENYFGFDIKKTKLEIKKLNRIDYKNDYKIKNEEEKIIIKNIYTKAVNKFSKNYCKKIEDGNFYKVKYSSGKSGYIEIITYYKGEEMELLVEEGKKTKEEADKYKDIIRTEVRIKNSRLNYEKNVKGISKDLCNYYDKMVAKMYFTYYIGKILGLEKFYRIDVAIDLILRTKSLKSDMKRKLVKLLRDINKNGYTKTKETYTSKATFYKHIRTIRGLGINILTFDEKINGIKIQVEYIDNFGIMKDDE